MFRLNKEEIDFMVPQNAIPSRKYLGKKWFAFSKFNKETINIQKELPLIS